MNRYIITDAQLDRYHRRSARIPERANTARLIVVPAQLIITNTAAVPGCNVDRIFYTMSSFNAFIDDHAPGLLK